MKTKDIVNIILKRSVIIFGGYVRDILSGDKPSDIDVWIKYDHSVIKDLLVDLCSFVPCQLIHKVDGNYSHMRIFSPKFEDLDHIDLVCYDPFVKADVDVNMLQLRKNGLLAEMFNILEIMENIKHRRFRRLPSCSDKRFQKMLDKGWTPIGI